MFDSIPGDFAVLLHAGMPIKQAIIYNMVSSVLCLLGMIVGISIGNLSSASLWIFAVIAGMFLYIALVDMVSNILEIFSFEELDIQTFFIAWRTAELPRCVWLNQKISIHLDLL